MKTITDIEAIEWCTRWPLQLQLNNDGMLCKPIDGRVYRVDLTKMTWRELLPTSRALALLASSSDSTFSGGLVWIRRMGIAVPEMENIIVHGLERVRMGYGENRSLETARAHLFREDELAECSTTLLMILLAEWDAYFVHPSGDWSAFIHHDDRIDISTKSAEIGRELVDVLETWGDVVEISINA